MPGISLAEFTNPLRKPVAAGIRVIDVWTDIILPELASFLREANELVRQDQIDAVSVLRPGFFTDLEASYIRRLTDDGNLPRTPWPGGGELPDVTWAFLQATGARPDQWEIDEILNADPPVPGLDIGADPFSGASLPLDPLRQMSAIWCRATALQPRGEYVVGRIPRTLFQRDHFSVGDLLRLRAPPWVEELRVVLPGRTKVI